MLYLQAYIIGFMLATNVKMLNSIKCEKCVLQQNQLDTQSGRKEYSTSMSEEKMNQRKFPPGSLYRHPSEVAPTLRRPAHQKSSSQSHLPFQAVGYSIACERHPQRNEDSFLIDPSCGMMAVFDGVGGSAAGEIASQTAEHATRLRWKQTWLQLSH